MDLSIIRKQQCFHEGHICQGNRLYLFEENQVLIFEAWPKLRAWRRLPGGSRFEPIHPAVVITLPGIDVQNDDADPITSKCDLLSQYDETKKRHVFQFNRFDFEGDDSEAALNTQRYYDFIEAIPLPVLSRIVRFHHSQWRLLQLCSKIPALLSLIDSHPALAFALANAAQFLDTQTPSIGRLRAKAQLAPEKLAVWLGFPDQPNIADILAKILPGACHVGSLLHIRSGTDNTLLQRLRLVDYMTMQLLTKPEYRLLCADEFIVEFAALAERKREALFKLINFARGLPEKIRSVAELKARKWTLRVNNILQKDGGSVYTGVDCFAKDFPEPPSFLSACEPTQSHAKAFEAGAAGTGLVVNDAWLYVILPDITERQHIELMDWLEAALQRMENENPCVLST